MLDQGSEFIDNDIEFILHFQNFQKLFMSIFWELMLISSKSDF